MKVIFSFLLISVSANAFASQCGEPLAGRTYCYSSGFEEKRTTFGADCAFTYWGRSAERVHSFQGTWALEGDMLSIHSAAGSGTRKLVFSDEGQAFTAVGYEQEVYRACN